VRSPLPDWLRPVAPKARQLATMGRRLADSGVYTVCQTARCPNIGECFGRGNATFLIMGNLCTRDCRFCAVEHARPLPLDPAEPQRIAEAARFLGLSYVVITSVTRDDLPDGGAAHFAATVASVRNTLPDAQVEVLTSDFQGSAEALSTMLAAGPNVFGHNVETVPRLYPMARPQASYSRSLDLLQRARTIAPEVPTKSGLMVGLGETEEEVLELLRDLRRAGASAVTIGQYLQPTRAHLPAVDYVTPQAFQRYEQAALALGFAHVLSGPLVRSSYHAAEAGLRRPAGLPSEARGEE